jgi:hypothetical protein
MKKLVFGFLILGAFGYFANPAAAQASLPGDECYTFTFKRLSEDPTPCQGPGTDCPLTICTDDWNP